MAGIVYVKSALWLAGCGGAGYVLMQIVTPSPSKINDIKSSSADSSLTYRNEKERNKALFMKRIQEATKETPIYLQKPKKDN